MEINLGDINLDNLLVIIDKINETQTGESVFFNFVHNYVRIFESQINSFVSTLRKRTIDAKTLCSKLKDTLKDIKCSHIQKSIDELQGRTFGQPIDINSRNCVIFILNFFKRCCDELDPSFIARAFGPVAAKATTKASESAYDSEMNVEIHRLIDQSVPEGLTLTGNGKNYRDPKDEYMYTLINELLKISPDTETILQKIETQTITGRNIQENKVYILYILISGLINHYKEGKEKDVKLITSLNYLQHILKELLEKYPTIDPILKSIFKYINSGEFIFVLKYNKFLEKKREEEVEALRKEEHEISEILNVVEDLRTKCRGKEDSLKNKLKHEENETKRLLLNIAYMAAITTTTRGGKKSRTAKKQHKRKSRTEKKQNKRKSRTAKKRRF
jgi:hypothetical protein